MNTDPLQQIIGDPVEIHAELIKIIKTGNYTVKSLADQIGVHPNTLHLFLKGAQRPQIHVLARITNFLNKMKEKQ